MEPTSSGTAVGMIGWKLIGGLAGLGAIGAGLAAIVVMCVLEPRTRQEWALCLIPTVMSSIGGGSFVIIHYSLQAWAYDLFGLMAMLGVVFTCGLPGWVIVRILFNYLNKVKNKDILEVANELRGRV